MREFRASDDDTLVMVDDDVVPPEGFVEKLAAAPFDIVSGVYCICPDTIFHLAVFELGADGYVVADGRGQTGATAVDAAGAGCLLIRRHVLDDPVMAKPFHGLSDADGVGVLGEDLAFCSRAKDAGYTIGAHWGVLCDHHVTTNALPQVATVRLLADLDPAGMALSRRAARAWLEQEIRPAAWPRRRNLNAVDSCFGAGPRGRAKRLGRTLGGVLRCAASGRRRPCSRRT